ncbi:putative disease resistance protein RGA3 [Elaeis guineensis]|uniref:putative disease resistance protein RGA3 n=1 Tax=Elaeis guineensis var. tenera TaxID=51953 RepID=UPI003C6D7F62
MAMIAEVFVSKFLDMLLASAIAEAAKMLGVPDEINKFHKRLKRIVLVVADAENFDSDAINHWLSELRDLMYDAEDIIEECRIEGRKFLRLKSSSSRCVVSVRFCYPPNIACMHKFRFHCKIGKRIRDLNIKLDELAKDTAFLRLACTPRDPHYKSTTISRRTSPVVELEVVGEKIENDTRMLVDLLIGEHKEKFAIFAIVGIGGIGKTTLAQKIYNDEKLRVNFHQMPRISLCASQDFPESDLLRSIIRQAGGDPGENKEKEVLEPMLSQVITNKRFFLILDDVWDSQVWDKLLRKPLQSGSADSRILITTRHEVIAGQMGSVYIHRVEKLSHEDGWSLICKMVFEKGDEQDMRDLSDTGTQIVKKCDGLPLALKTIGGVLRTKEKKRSEWKKVLSSPTWSSTKLPKGVRGALYLSYHDLPSPLKQCFICLSLFPEDFIIHESVFVNSCIAEGFVTSKDVSVFVNSCIAEGFVTSKDVTPLEDVAKEWWKELVQRNILQPDPNWYDESACRMHDLLRSLAQNIAGDECFVGDARAFENKIMDPSSPIKLRHLSIVDGNIETIPDLIMERTSLRTLSFFRSPHFNILPKDLYRKLRSLRVLNLSGTTINSLRTSLGDLVHLRSLDISHTPIREIPESIGNLTNLQFLMLQNCKCLHSLPSGVLGLISLRNLNVEDTPLDGLPMGIGRLQQLYSIWGFVVNGSEGGRSIVGDGGKQEHKGHKDGSFCTLEELKSLSQLRYLSIYKLERVSNRAEARAAALEAKPHLLFLQMYCTLPSSSSDVQEEIKRIGEVFEELRPPPCLEQFEIHGYFGREFPSWMMSPSSSLLPNIRRLYLNNCALCQQLPPLGMLPRLDYLRIEGASAIMSVGPEFLLLACGRKIDSSFSTYFPKLRHLRFEDMPNWEEWWWGWEEKDNQTTSLLPSLKEMTIYGCPKLKSLPESLLCHATALKRLQIKDAHSLREVQNLPPLTELILIRNSSLERVSNFPALKYLEISHCGKLKGVEGVDAVEHIQLDDREAESLPKWSVGAGEEQPRFPSLNKLTLCNKIYRRGLPASKRCESTCQLRDTLHHSRPFRYLSSIFTKNEQHHYFTCLARRSQHHGPILTRSKTSLTTIFRGIHIGNV